MVAFDKSLIIQFEKVLKAFQEFKVCVESHPGCVPKAAVPSPMAHTTTIVPYTEVKAKNTPAKPQRFKVKINSLGCDDDAVSEHS